MIEEFPFTTRVLQAEKDTHSLRKLIATHTKDVKDKLASQTWTRKTWYERATENQIVAVDIDSTEDFVMYHLPHSVVVCETLSQMQFGGTQYPTKHVHHLHCNENCCYCDIE
jgi:hypothetical protein